MILPVLGLVAALGVAAFVAWERHDTARTFIEADLRRIHATDYTISIDIFDSDRDTYSYDVVYTDRNGRVARNHCKVATSLTADGRVYWASPLK